MVFFAKDPDSGRFVCYQSNAISVNICTGRVTSHHHPQFAALRASIAGDRAAVHGRPVDGSNNPGIQLMLNVLNSRLVDADCSDDSDDGVPYNSDSDGDGSYHSSDSESEEIECNDSERLTVRKGKKLLTYKKLNESSPRRHAFFPDVTPSSEDETSPSMHWLDDGCMSHVISHLSVLDLFRISPVCKRWYNLSAARLSSMKRLSVLQVWRDLPKLGEEDEVEDDDSDAGGSKTYNTPQITQSNLVTILTATAGNLTELYLDTSVGEDSYSSVYISKEISTGVSRFCRNLETLVITFTKIGGTVGLESFIKHLPIKNKLRNLSLKASVRRRDGMMLTENMLGDFLKKTKGLERLHIEGCEQITGVSIVKYLKNHKMKWFTFATCRNIDTDVLEFIRKNHHETLEHLGFYTSMPHGGFSDLDYDLVTNSKSLQITYHSPKLENMKSLWAMKYDDCMPISFSPEGVNSSLLRLMPNLVELNLSFNCDLDENPLFLRSLAAQCPLIEVLKLCGAHIASIKPLKYLENLFFLKDLDLENVCTNYAVPRWSMFDFDGFSRQIASLLKALKRLNFSGTDIGESAIFSIIRNNHSLSFLDVTSHAGEEKLIKGRFIENCHGISRTSPITVAMEIDDELSVKEVRKLKAAIDKRPNFLTIDTEYMDMTIKPNGWFNKHFEFTDDSLFE